MASSIMPSNRWMVTITGCSLRVTVQAPKAPCTSTDASSASGMAGLKTSLWVRRHCLTEVNSSARISAPMPIAR